jgi:type IV secretory pathway VirD2 relaxase
MDVSFGECAEKGAAMSSSTRPGMAKAEDKVEEQCQETGQLAERVHYTHRLVGMHEVASPLASEQPAGNREQAASAEDPGRKTEETTTADHQQESEQEPEHAKPASRSRAIGAPGH